MYHTFYIWVPFHKAHAVLRTRGYNGAAMLTELVALEGACSQRCARFVKHAPGRRSILTLEEQLLSCINTF